MDFEFHSTSILTFHHNFQSHGLHLIGAFGSFLLCLQFHIRSHPISQIRIIDFLYHMEKLMQNR